MSSISTSCCFRRRSKRISWTIKRKVKIISIENLYLLYIFNLLNYLNRYEERHTKSFSASFHVADLTRDPFDTWDPPLAHSVQFNSVSCQFALHYCFESQKQCLQFIKNAANRLKPGGFFFGCTPWAEEIVRR